MPDLRNLLKISDDRLAEINAFLTDPDNELINNILRVVEKYGGPAEINRKAKEAGTFEALMDRLRKEGSSYVEDLEWLVEQRDTSAFTSMPEYYARVLGDAAEGTEVKQGNRVTLEISALQYFPWLITQARRAIEKRELMPGRYIRVRNMQEQKEDNGDIMAMAAAMMMPRIQGAAG